MKTKFWGPLIVICLAFQLSACSSSEKKDELDGSDGMVPPESSDAGTDAVPQSGAEGVSQAAEVATDSAASVGGGGITDYTVQAGDTLMKIAFETYGDVYKWKNILEANKDTVSDPKSLKEGTILKLELPATPVVVDRNGEKYLIKDGDTLGKISGAVYGSPSKWKELWENNKQLIHDPNKIFAGFYLYYLSNGSGTNLASPATDATSLQQAAGQVAPGEAAPVEGTAPAAGAAPVDLSSMSAAISAAAPSPDLGAPAPDAAPEAGK
jgi:hypothetical protein